MNEVPEQARGIDLIVQLVPALLDHMKALHKLHKELSEAHVALIGQAVDGKGSLTVEQLKTAVERLEKNGEAYHVLVHSLPKLQAA